mmetsp:Transcript_14932/g.40887  ORF Transcript_14932/g.40887 Transcript_14932/m.40887 type:complete len:98 (-) Transcript_14932:53-346(-)
MRQVEQAPRQGGVHMVTSDSCGYTRRADPGGQEAARQGEIYFFVILYEIYMIIHGEWIRELDKLRGRVEFIIIQYLTDIHDDHKKSKMCLCFCVVCQ